MPGKGRKHFFIEPLKKIPSKTAQEARWTVKNGKPYKYEDAELKAVRAKFMAILAKHKPSEVFEGPLMLKVVWCYKADKNHEAGTYKATKPDTDNLDKLLKDCMTAVGYWHDDAQVAVEHIEKGYGDAECIYIEVEELEGQ